MFRSTHMWATGFLALALFTPSAEAEPGRGPVRIATWNIENMSKLFDQSRLPYRSQNRQELYDDEEDLLEIALVLKQDRFDPDVLVLQEAASQQSLERFNTKWLDDKYAFVKQYKSNSKGQWTAILAKPGFKVIETRSYAGVEDPVDDPKLGDAKRYYGENVLYPRGPAFAQIRTPDGTVMWIGTTHIKSKYGNNAAVTRWRIRQVKKLREIASELGEDTKRVAILGDFNDTFGRDNFEQKVDQDAIQAMLEHKEDQAMVSPTQSLAQDQPTAGTYHATLKPGNPSFIDHVFVSPALDEAIIDTTIIDPPIAHVASDHLPVMITVDP